MKTIALGQVIDEATDLETVAMTIDEGSVSVLMRNLTNLYSNPSKAVFREYVSNALDSHIKAGVDTPIEVTLPDYSDYEPTFVVKDFGVGLSKQEIIDIYSRYGSSTKRESNDQIGAFGLGAKSALAITDRFDVISVKDGVRLEFFVKKNGQGVGVVHFVEEVASTLGNGVEIRIPVPKNKVNDFSTIAETFFKTWKPNTVKVDGVLNSATIYNEELYTPITSGGEPLAWISKGDGSYRYNSGGLSGINFIVGGIVYNISSREVSSNGGHADKVLGYGGDLTKKYSDITRNSQGGTFMNLPIGSVELTPSREELMLTDRTVATIVAVVEDFIEQAPLQFSNFLNTLDRADAVKFYGENASFFTSTEVKWQGEVMPENIILSGVGYKVTSMEGVSMKDPSVVDRIHLVSSIVKSDYRSSETIVVRSAGSNMGVATIVRKNLRDYASSVFNSKNITAFVIADSEKGAWLDLIPSVSLDKFVEIAKTFRSAKKSLAQTGSTRTKATYVVWNGGDTVEKISADSIEGEIVYAVEDKSILNSLFNSNIRDAYKGSTRGLGSDTVTSLKAMFAGKTIVFVPSNRSENVFKKQYPKAVEINSFFGTKVAEMTKAENLDSQVFATLVRSNRYASSLISIFGTLPLSEANRIQNTVIRSLAFEASNKDSRLVAMSEYARHYVVAGENGVLTEKGFALNEILPLLTGTSPYRMSKEQQAQFVDFVNFVVTK